MQKAEIGKNKIEQAFALYDPNGQYRLAVKDIAQILEVNIRTVRGYIYRTRHPDRYAERVAVYIEKHRRKKPAKEVQKPKPTDKVSAVKRAKQLKQKKVKKVVAEPKVETGLKADIVAIINRAQTKGKSK